MSRLFFSLFSSIAFALICFYFAAEYIPGKILHGLFLDYQQKTYQGTVHLLNQRLNNSVNQQEELKKIQSMFGYSVQLESLDKLNLNQSQRNQISNKGISFEEIDNADFIYYPSAIANKIWVLQTEQTETEDYQRVAKGTMSMIEEQLQTIPSDKWPQQIETIAKNFSFNLEIHDLENLQLTDELAQRVVDGELMSLDYETDNEQYFYRLANSNYYIQAGPIKDIWVAKYLVYSIFIFLGLLVSMAILIWIFPLWKSLMALNTAANELGKGRFDTRVQSNSFTPIRKITESFNLMAEHIQRLIMSHKDLTNAVSHELRTPLSRLRFGLDMMQSSKDETRRLHYYKEMSTDIDELDALIAELLTYARFEREDMPIKYEECDLLKWLNYQSKRYDALAKDKTIITNFNSINSNEAVQMEPRLMARALSNLVTNAIRHASKTILINAKIQNQALNLSVEDDGSGIDDALGEVIFEPFKRADQSRVRDTGGFGLGLAIVKHIVLRHNGSVKLTQSNLGGAHFVICIPLNKVIT